MKLNLPTTSQEAALFAAFAADPGDHTRNAIVLAYMPLVQHIAGRICDKLRNGVDPADLESFGVLGLIDAIPKFKPSRGFAFATYAPGRIRGAIFDELRETADRPRMMMDRAKKWHAVSSQFYAHAGRPPTNSEMRAAIGNVNDRQWAGYLKAAASDLQTASLDDVVTVEGEQPITRAETFADRRAKNVGAEIEVREILNIVVERFSVTDAIILRWHCLEGYMVGEVAEWLGVTQSRVFQRMRKVLPALRQLAA